MKNILLLIIAFPFLVNAQNVGVGTSNPLSRLHVGPGTNNFDIQTRVDGRIQSNSTSGGLWFGDNTSTDAGFIGNAGTNLSGIFTAPLNNWAIGINNTTGNVGIGTLSPSNPLTVSSGATQFPTAIFIQPSTHTNSRRAAIGLDDWYWMQDIYGTGTKDFMLFQASVGGRLFVGTNGNVGLGVFYAGDNNARLSVSRDNVGPCCGGENATLAIGDALSTGRRASISFHTSGESEGKIELTQAPTAIGAVGVNRRLRFFDHQNQGLGIQITGNLWYGTNDSRTQTRDNAGLQGNAGAQSGFYEFNQPSGNSQNYNYPAGYNGNTWWHMIDTRHSNPTNNFALQIAGNFFDQRLFFRKTDNSASKAWSEIHNTALYNDKGTESGNINDGSVQDILTSSNLDVKAGERYIITVLADLRNVSGNGEDRWRIFLQRNNVSGCSSGEIGRVPTSDPESDHNTWHTYSHQFVWIANCSGTVSFTLQAQRFDSDDIWRHGTSRIIVSRF